MFTYTFCRDTLAYCNDEIDLEDFANVLLSLLLLALCVVFDIILGVFEILYIVFKLILRKIRK